MEPLHDSSRIDIVPLSLKINVTVGRVSFFIIIISSLIDDLRLIPTYGQPPTHVLCVGDIFFGSIFWGFSHSLSLLRPFFSFPALRSLYVVPNTEGWNEMCNMDPPGKGLPTRP